MMALSGQQNCFLVTSLFLLSRKDFVSYVVSFNIIRDIDRGRTSQHQSV